ncbi:MAG: protein kinase [Planctomycetaceae bacterium]|nr:protein kinase [Planctomycetaceae bacterium]
MPADEEPSELAVQAFREYLQCVDAGEALDRQTFVARFPDIAGELAQHLEAEETLRTLAGSAFADSQAAVATMVAARTDPVHETILTDGDSSTGNQQPADWSISRHIGRYRVEKLLGQGGMGAVYLAHDMHLDRDVALKIPQINHLREKELLERFYREARAVATLRHPGICPVYDVGEINGQTFLSMAFIQGRPLVEYSRSSASQSSRAIAKLIMQLALALQEAHDIGVIHRDLKPANIMVSSRGEPVVMDFGLARRLHSDDARVTHSGDILGTPAYMSPEQVEGNPEGVGPASDQYSLGVILYELLTGQLPFQGTVLSIIGQIAHTTPKSVQELRADVDPRLAAICSRMMARQPKARFPDMAATAAALRQYLDEGVASPDAGKVSGWDVDLARSQVGRAELSGNHSLPQPATILSGEAARPRRRNWWLAGAAVVLALAALLSAVLFLSQKRDGAVRFEFVDPEIEVEFAGQPVPVNEKQVTIHVPPGNYTLKARRDSLWIRSREFEVEEQESVSIRVTWQDGELHARAGNELILRELLERQPPPLAVTNVAEAAPAASSENSIRLVGKLRGARDSGNENSLAVSADGKWLVSAGGGDCTAWFWNLENWESAGIFKKHGTVNAVDLTADARLAAVVEFSGNVAVWETETGVLRFRKRAQSGSMTVVKFLPDQKRLITGSSAGDVNLWDAETGELLQRFKVAGYIHDLRVVPGGRQVLVHCPEITLCHLETGVSEQLPMLNLTRTSAFSQNGQLMLGGLIDGEIKLWDFEKRVPVRAFYGHGDAPIGRLEFLPDEKHFVSGGHDGTIRLWEIESGREVARVEGLGHLAYCVLALPDGRHVLSTDGYRGSQEYAGPFENDFDIRVWQLPQSVWPVGESGEPRFLETTAASYREAQLAISLLRELHGHTKRVESVDFSADDRWLVSTSQDGTARIWDVQTGAELHQLELGGSAGSDAAFTPDGKFVLYGRSESRLPLWSTATGELTPLPDGPPVDARAVKVSPDGTLVATGGQKICLWSLPAGELVRQLETDGFCYSLTFTPDGERLITGHPGIGMSVWNVATGSREYQLAQPGGPIYDVAVTENNRYLLSCGNVVGSKLQEGQPGLQLWDLGSGTLIRDLGMRQQPAVSMALSPAGRFFATGCMDGLIRIREVQTGEEYLVQQTSSHAVGGLAFSASGKLLASASADGVVRLWKLPGSIHSGTP